MNAPIRVDLQLIADMVEPGTRALDVGCGEGRFCRMMQDRGVQTVGIDPAKGLIARATANSA